MKKFLTMALIAFSIGIVASSAEAKTSGSASALTTNAGEPQVRIRVGGNRRRNRRVYRTTRVSPNGRRVVTTTRRVSPNGRRVVIRKRVVRRPYRRY